MADNLNNETTTVDTETVETENKGKYYTEEEIALIEQKAGDKRISQYQKTLEKKNREADRLSKMTADERYEYQLQERERLLEEKEKALILAENKNVVSQILSEKGLSLAFVDFCVDEDADVMKSKIAKIEKAFKASVKAEVEKRIGSNAPKVSTPDSNELTREKFSKLSLSQKQALYNSDRELYNSMTSR